MLRAPNGLDYLLSSQKGGYWRLAGGMIEKWNTNQMEGQSVPYPWKGSAFYPWNRPAFPISACEDLEGNLVVGTFGDGIWWFDAQGSAAHISETNGLSHSTILSLCMDREGSLWVGTDGRGLDRVRKSSFEVLEGSEGKTVQSVSEGAAGDLWVGFNGGGVVRWKDETQHDFGGAPNSYVKIRFRGQGTAECGRARGAAAAVAAGGAGSI